MMVGIAVEVIGRSWNCHSTWKRSQAGSLTMFMALFLASPPIGQWELSVLIFPLQKLCYPCYGPAAVQPARG